MIPKNFKYLDSFVLPKEMQENILLKKNKKIDIKACTNQKNRTALFRKSILKEYVNIN
jgi:hypothetical protein